MYYESKMKYDYQNFNKKNYNMKYHVILGRFKWHIYGFTEFMREQ